MKQFDIVLTLDYYHESSLEAADYELADNHELKHDLEDEVVTKAKEVLNTWQPDCIEDYDSNNDELTLYCYVEDNVTEEDAKFHAQKLDSIEVYIEQEVCHGPQLDVDDFGPSSFVDFYCAVIDAEVKEFSDYIEESCKDCILPDKGAGVAMFNSMMGESMETKQFQIYYKLYGKGDGLHSKVISAPTVQDATSIFYDTMDEAMKTPIVIDIKEIGG